LGRTDGAAAERILRLAAYLDRHKGEAHTLDGLTAAVPGYGSAPRDARGRLVRGTPEWEALRRRLRRDLADLDEHFGVVVRFDEPEQCWRLEPPFLTRRERDALLAAAAAVDVEGLPEPAPSDLGGAVDPSGSRAVVWVHARVVDLLEARRSGTPVAFAYRGRQRTFRPYALGMWRNRWYAAGAEDGAGGVRVFRLDRIEDDPGGGPAIRPAGPAGSYRVPDDFRADAALALDPNDWGTDPPVTAQLEVARHRLPALQRELGGRVVREDAATALVELTVRHYTSFRVRVTAFGRDARLLGPPELVEDLVAWLAATAGEEART
jgi:predicted DNA-binding transcriptional regulator YafY